MTTAPERHVDVLVLGGGFGGLAAVHRLRELLGPDPEIVLVDRGDRFVMGFAKLWDLAGTRPLAGGTRSLHNLDAHGVTFVQADVVEVEAARRAVRTSSGSFTADALIVALGAESASAHAEMLRPAHAHNLYEISQLPALRADLDRITSGRVVVSILGGPHKCPPAPYEAALIINGLLRDRGVRQDVEVILTTPAPITLPVAGPDASKYVADHLAAFDVAIRPEHRVTGVDERDGRLVVSYDGNDDLEADLLVGVPANVAPALLRDHPLLGPSGWIEVDRHTFRTGFDGVWAVGDCTMVPTATGQLPMAGVFAAAGGLAAAEDIAAGRGIGDGPDYDGHGFCFLELPDEKVAFVEGNFYADPPQVALTEADHEQFQRKLAYEREGLDRWLPEG